MPLTNMKKWTIGIVNYKSSVYLECQMKILYEFNDPNSFKIIIIDNSAPHEIEALSKIAKQYERYSNMEIIYFNPSSEPWMRGSGQHGEGLNEVLKKTDTEYLLVHDPDFFFVQKDFLNILAKKLDEGNFSIGAPYRNMHGIETGNIGKPDFPSAFGAAYKVSEIKNLSFLPGIKEDLFKQGDICWISPAGADVGWEMRDKLSDKKYISFSQKRAEMLKYYFGDYSFNQEPYEYFLDGKRIAYHLFKGSFVADGKKFSTLKLDHQTPENWNKARKEIAKYFYEVAQNGISLPLYLKMCHKYYIANFMLIDEILDKLLYKPFCLIFKVLSKALHKLFFRLTHPVAFVKRKIRNYKLKNLF
ncbi:MAG: hypothetical protein K0R25_925 [Rickettsiaceae bacterium]|jgi:hypothetical protein|nr:hypothetical protein [Rickettsiaceae bacterium]